eukprot:TRINITY_DN1777_c0_g1_i1.p1 TRINITY_DN1777_c0_g1~~TRINITY_DN1777_c0_g1_i1.p1  ORF type:complete len:235 (-),score=46.29 TRINITY_DN1777_c0_g1_i1:38-742(-)
MRCYNVTADELLSEKPVPQELMGGRKFAPKMVGQWGIFAASVVGASVGGVLAYLDPVSMQMTQLYSFPQSYGQPCVPLALAIDNLNPSVWNLYTFVSYWQTPTIAVIHLWNITWQQGSPPIVAQIPMIQLNFYQYYDTVAIVNPLNSHILVKHGKEIFDIDPVALTKTHWLVLPTDDNSQNTAYDHDGFVWYVGGGPVYAIDIRNANITRTIAVKLPTDQATIVGLSFAAAALD